MNRHASTADINRSPIEHLNALILAPGTVNAGAPAWQRYFDPIPALSEGLPAPFLGIMLLIWQLRDQDLQQRYPLRSKQSRLGFIGWCIVHGRREYRALQQASKFWEALAQPAHLSACLPASDDPAHALSWLMVLAAMERSDLTINLHTIEGRQQLLAWYLLHGRCELGLDQESLAPWQIQYLFSPSALPGLNRLQALVYHCRSDVRRNFPLPFAKTHYLDWFRNFISRETRLIDALRSRDGAITGEASGPGESRHPFGVNIIGYAFGQLGIGEDARMAAKSLLTTEIPVTMLDFPPGPDIPQADTSMKQHVSQLPQYSINMVCLTALEHGRLFAERGTTIFEGRYTIGYWPWELPAWPMQWRHLPALVNEIWVSSQYTFDAISPISPVPVRLMPMAVALDKFTKRSRAYFGLPEKACLFLFAFDLGSSAKRKNPQACVDAFLEAFPKSGHMTLGPDQVGLVIKVHPPKRPNRAWTMLKKLQQKDPRIHIIEQTLSKSDLLALYSTCDCFISLHRAEGFGRCIAEAMLIGKPVISTGFSGSLSFTSDENALLVGHTLQALAKHDYPYGEGQYWAEPDISDAARQMRRVVEESESIDAIAAIGQAQIKKIHAPRVIGRRYANAIQNALQNQPTELGKSKPERQSRTI